VFYGLLSNKLENVGSVSRKWHDKMLCANKNPAKGQKTQI